MERPNDYTMIKHNGEPGWKLPYAYKLLPSGGRVVVVDPKGVSRLVSRKSLALH